MKYFIEEPVVLQNVKKITRSQSWVDHVSYFFSVSLFCYSVQQHHSFSPPSILLCQSTTDIPRDVTSTSRLLCPLFTCKSFKLVTHTCTHATKILLIIPENIFDSAASRTSTTSLLLMAIPIKLLNFLPPVGAEHPPHGCWAPFFAFQDQRPRPCMCATWSACQRHANEHVSETWKWEQGEGSLGACDSHKSSDQALSREGSNASADIYPSLTDTDGLLTHELYTTNHPAPSNHMNAQAIKYEVR